MEKTLETLCTFFDDELERQETMLAVLHSQREAALAHDSEAVEAKTAAIEVLIQETVQAEGERRPLLQHVVDHYALPVERQTLSELIRVAPEPWRSRMSDFQRQIRAVVQEAQALVRQNGDVLRKSLRVVGDCLGILECGAPANGAHYDARGMEQPRRERQPSIIDEKG